jgi:hypothetical protein
MEQGIQWGDFVDLWKNDLDYQITAACKLLVRSKEWFGKEEFKDLTLNDFKVELVFREPSDRYPNGTVGLKLTKK